MGSWEALVARLPSLLISSGISARTGFCRDADEHFPVVLSYIVLSILATRAADFIPKYPVVGARQQSPHRSKIPRYEPVEVGHMEWLRCVCLSGSQVSLELCTGSVPWGDMGLTNIARQVREVLQALVHINIERFNTSFQPRYISAVHEFLTCKYFTGID